MSAGAPQDQSGGARRPEGVVDRVIAAYPRFSQSAERLLAERPSEAILLSFMMLAGLVRFMGLVMGGVLAEGRADIAVVQSGLVGALLVAPLGVYFLSAALSPLLRAFGGDGDGYATRAGMAWSLAVATPALFGASLLDGAGVGLRALGAAFASGQGVSEGAIAGGIAALALLGLAAYILSACLSAAHGFRSPARVLAGLLGGAGALALAAQGAYWALGGGSHV